MKAKARFFRGIEFVEVAELPDNQRLLLQYATTMERIKILIDGKIVSNCIQYHDYCHWYISVYKTSVPASPENVTPAIPVAVHKA